MFSKVLVEEEGAQGVGDVGLHVVFEGGEVIEAGFVFSSTCTQTRKQLCGLVVVFCC